MPDNDQQDRRDARRFQLLFCPLQIPAYAAVAAVAAAAAAAAAAEEADNGRGTEGNISGVDRDPGNGDAHLRQHGKLKTWSGLAPTERMATAGPI